MNVFASTIPGKHENVNYAENGKLAKIEQKYMQPYNKVLRRVSFYSEFVVDASHRTFFIIAQVRFTLEVYRDIYEIVWLSRTNFFH